MGSRADVPVVSDNGNASRTVHWGFADKTNLSLVDTQLVDGHAELNWSYKNLSSPNGPSLAANGSLGRNLTLGTGGIELKSDPANHVIDGTFLAAPPWAYANSTDGNVTASWEASPGDGRMNYSSASTQRLWDGLDGTTPQLQSHWAAIAGACAVTLTADPADPHTPPGMMNVTLSSGSCGNLNVVNTSGAQNWSDVDRLVFWSDIPSALSSPSFNLSALVGLVPHFTKDQLLSHGPQQVVVDLDQLGTSRSALSSVTLHFNFQTITVTTPISVFLDDLWLGDAKVLNQTATISQLVAKMNLTSPRPGSALLSFDWILANNTGVGSAASLVNLTDGPDSSEFPLVGPPATWNHFSADVSSTTTAGVLYNLSFRLEVDVNNTEASNVTFRVDNVTLFFPNRTNGTYVSKTISLGADSEFLQLAWGASIPSATTVSFQLSTGNTANGTGPGWSGWSAWAAPGLYALSVPPNMYFRVRASLATTNASITPVLVSASLGTRHRVVSGSVASSFVALPDFIRWDRVSVRWSGPMATTTRLYLGNGSFWTPWSLDANISTFSGRAIAWRVDLGTADGLQTPALLGVNLTYEYLGPPARVVVLASSQPLSPSTVLNVTAGRAVQLGAVVYDAGSHDIPATGYSLGWQISNGTGGSVYPNGTYVAGKPGLYTILVIVTAAAGGTTVHASVVVNVTAASTAQGTPRLSLWDLWPAYLVAIAAALGFAVYELVIRRMFAIDDVFLIAKDGRLILHNTRRMRADRDEDILSGMLTAIMAFLRDQDPEENGEFKQFQVGGKTTLLERGQHVYLTAVYSGRVPRWAGKDLHRFMVDLESRFGDAFAHWSGSPEDLHGLKDYMGRFVSHVRYHADRSAAEAAS